MTKKRKVFSFNSELYKVTGVQRVLMDIHRAVCDDYEARVVGTVPYERVHKDIGLSCGEYVRFRNPLMFRGSIVIVHERKFLALFWLLNHLLFQRIRVVYVHHNVLTGWRHIPIWPKYIVAISDSGIANLTDYFNVPISRVHKIYNCVNDNGRKEHKSPAKDEIMILYPARVNDVKRQVDVVETLTGKIDKRIKIYFAGEGPLLNLLRQQTCNSRQFVVLGYRNDMLDLLQAMDYVMLYSKHEGLPITLIEATMCGIPIICNDVGGNIEIAHDNQNAFVVNTWDELIDKLNDLPAVGIDKYLKMSKKSREIYEANFTFNEFRENYLKLLSNIK